MIVEKGGKKSKPTRRIHQECKKKKKERKTRGGCLHLGGKKEKKRKTFQTKKRMAADLGQEREEGTAM